MSRSLWPHQRLLLFCFFFVYPPADGEKKTAGKNSPHFHVFSYTSSVNFTQLRSQSSWFSVVSFGSRGSNSAGFVVVR